MTAGMTVRALTMRTLTIRSRAILAAVLVVVGLGVVWLIANSTGTRTVTAYFAQTVNLYPADQVRVLGVQIGTIERVEPLNDSVRVVMRYDSDVPLPAEATAAVISPTLVGVRYVQLGPPYEAGPTMADGATIPIERTATPVEFDEIKVQLHRLAEALAPKANETSGALNRLLDTSSANLQGEGPAIRATLQKLSQATTTLSNGRHDLFGTVRNLQTFVTALKESDQQVARFQSQLAQVSGVLADNRKELAEALNALDRTAPVIERFVKDNRGRLVEDVEKLVHVVRNVSDNRQAVADVVQKAPFALSNFVNFVDEQSGAVTAVLAGTNMRDPASFVCDAIVTAAPGGGSDPTAARACRTGLGPLLQLARYDVVPPVAVNPLVRGGGPSSGPQLPLVVPSGGR